MASTLFKAEAAIVSVLAITLIVLSIIGLTASSSGPFNVIVQFGKTTNGLLLGSSIFAFIMDMVWLGVLCKKKNAQEASLKPVSLQPTNTQEESLKHASSQNALVIEGQEQFNDTDPFAPNPNMGLPNELILMVMGYLPGPQQVACDRLNRRFCRLSLANELLRAFNLRDISSRIKVFDASDWDAHVDMSAYGLITEDMPRCDVRKMTTFLQSLLASRLMTSIRSDLGVTLLTMPKGLSLKKLIQLAALPKVGRSVSFGSILRVLEKIGDIEVNRTYQIVITNGILEGSRNCSSDDQALLLHQFSCRMPSVLEAMVLQVVICMSAEQHLLSEIRKDYFTRCFDPLIQQYSSVGNASYFNTYSVHAYLADELNSTLIGVCGVLQCV